jgi:hypothetical protein
MDKFVEEVEAGQRTAGRGHTEDFHEEVKAGQSSAARVQERLELELVAGRRVMERVGG